MAAQNERVKFRLIHMPCCGQLVCWVNPRLPNFCPECGRQVLTELRHLHPERILITDDQAWLRYNDGGYIPR